jgi:hypothetical protein
MTSGSIQTLQTQTSERPKQKQAEQIQTEQAQPAKVQPGNNGTGKDRKPQGPLIVVGMWRSGTSLLYALLNQHPQIALMYEGDLPLLWPLFLRGRAKKDWPERWQFWNSAPSRHRLEIDELPRDVSGLGEACQAAWKRYAGSAIGGCKSPNYYDMLPELATEFPNARFIVIRRNPLDVCRSVVRAAKGDSFFARRGMILRALCGSYDLNAGVENLRARRVPVHEIEYETLVNDAQTTLAGVCRFLNLSAHAGMTDLRNADRSAIYEGAHHERVKSEEIKVDSKQNEMADLMTTTVWGSSSTSLLKLALQAQEVLPGRALRKIERYMAFSEGEAGKKIPAGFALEKFWDRCLYRALRGFDQAVACIYCFAPLWLLRKYRATKARRPDAVASKETLVGVSVKD